MADPLNRPANFHETVPEGDERERLVCKDCGFIAYENPRIITGSVVEHDGKIMLCRRAINPQHGKWTIPAGFLELGEAPAEGAVREAYEEATARIEIRDLLAVYSVRRISQVQMMYRARLASPEFAPGYESLEVGLFAWEDIPWDELAFPSVHWVLNHYRAVMDQDSIVPFTNPEGWEQA
ncbi:NUDIX hydrolase [Kordiimonas marina]|uniref:NUDIX hydrolase n=1 Tax=Kordiimonas marina TaxID=2872312 RepID=UPI001FF2D9E5|nr:NUDIX hydrolase [Kordiimonas marina]MCJ9428105.1 NUDIX hydrolase [Kordiimonas marina]